MAYEGLFGIGDAGTLNNRDLVQEARDIEKHRQDVLRFKETQKGWEEARAKARKENRDELYDNYFDTGEIHINYQDFIRNRIGSHHQWLMDNEDESGNIKEDSQAEYRQRELQILDQVRALKERTTDYNATVLDMRNEGTNINLYKRAEDGTYLLDYNENLFLEELIKNNKITDSLPVDLASVKGIPQPTKGSTEYIKDQKTKKEGLLFDRDKRETMSNNTKTTTAYYTDDKLNIIENNIYERLNPNELYLSNGDVAKSTWIVDYMDKSNQTRFMEDNTLGGIDNRSVLDPLSDSYNNDIADLYAKWLAKDLTKPLRQEEIISEEYVKPENDDDKPTSILTQADVNLYTKPTPSDRPEGNGFVIAKNTYKTVKLNKHKDTRNIRESDLYSTENQSQVFIDNETGNPISFNNIAGPEASKTGEAVSVLGTLEATMQLENGDFVGLYEINDQYSALVSFDDIDGGTFKVVKGEDPSQQLKQFEYHNLKQKPPTGTDDLSIFNKSAQEIPAQEISEAEFIYKGVGATSTPTYDGKISLFNREVDFSGHLTKEDTDLLRKKGVYKIEWRPTQTKAGDIIVDQEKNGIILKLPYQSYPLNRVGFKYGMMDIIDEINKLQRKS